MSNRGSKSKRKTPSKVAARPAWRAFEQLVARIEHQVAPKGAVVRSPDRLPDRHTGQLREVDASVRFTVGTVPLLITFECRKRSRAQDVTWIEQLAEKHRSVGATRVIAVAAGKGFSSAAKTKAEALGVELRLVADITDAEIGRWIIKTSGLKRQRTRIAILAVAFSLEGGNGSHVYEAIRSEGLGARILHDSRGARHSLNDLVGFMHDEGLPRPASTGAADVLPVTWRPDQGIAYYVDTATGRQKVRAITLWLSMKNEGEDPVPLSTVHEYSGPDGALRFVAEGHWVEPETGDHYTVLASRTGDDPELQQVRTGPIPAASDSPRPT